MEDPAPLTITLEPLDDHLIVEPVDEDVETRTGLIIPQSAEAGCRTGIVTAVGRPTASTRVKRCSSRRTPATTSGWAGWRARCSIVAS